MTPKELLTSNEQLIERHIGLGETPIAISNNTGIPVRSVDAIISLYMQPVTHPIVMQSKVNYGYRDWFIFYNWNTLAVQEIAEVMACSTLVIERRAKFLNLGRKRRIVINKPVFHYKNKTVVLNTVTGIYYLSNKEAAATINMNHSTFKNKLNGNRKNTTDFIKVA